MTATNHVITGALIAIAVPGPLALPLAAGSHFVLDALPHFGLKEHTNKTFIRVLLFDMALASVILLALLVIRPANWLLLIAAGIFSSSPDLMWFKPFIKELKNEPVPKPGLVRRFHSSIQWGESPKGAIVEIIWFAMGSWLLLSLL